MSVQLQMENIGVPLDETISNSCAHLNSVADAVKNNYHVVLAYYVACIADEASKRKATDAYCRICKAKNRRIHACLECAFFGCLAGKRECQDYVYNKTFEEILNDYKVEARRINGSPQYLPWVPQKEEIALLKDKIKKIADHSYIGLRGIINIGSCCYVSCIIQVLMHNPLLKDYFLSDKHKCFKKTPDACLTCELFVLFQEFYSGVTLPLDPMRFFHVLQKFCKWRLGQDQQDTFEAFEEILTGLQSSCQETHETDNCNCMVHQIFYGITEISRKCLHCEHSSLLPRDHFRDHHILLDVEGSNDSIEEILKRKFLVPELLRDYLCSVCMKKDTTYSYQTIKKLPAVICFRLNCFKCKSNTDMVKISTAFAFKDSIDMSIYLNSKDNIKLSNGSNMSSSDSMVNRYFLFGVIYHKGTAKGGHYIAYIQQCRNRWFECNDTNIYETSLKEVLKCEPILLFYYKQL